jgi:hypothetical protein
MIGSYSEEQLTGLQWPTPEPGPFNPIMLQWTPLASSEVLGETLSGQQIQQSVGQQEEDLKLLQKEYVFTEPKSVESFLKSHRYLMPILMEALPQLKRSFGSDVTFQLSVSPDENPPKTIYGVVAWKGSLGDARSALKSFDESWWLESIKKASGRVVFDYELA